MDRAQAQRVAEEWERLAKGERPASGEQARRVLEEVMGRLMGGSGGELRVSCAGYVERWLGKMRGTVKGSTLAFYRGTLRSWLRWLGPRAEGDLRSVSEEWLLVWREEESRRVRGKTVSHREKALKAMFREALREGYVSVDPTAGLRRLRQGDDGVPRRPFTREEMGRVLELAEGDWRLMVLLGLQTGQRLGDVVRLRWEAIDVEGRLWRLRQQKKGRGIVAPLSGEVAGLLRDRARDGSGFVFPGMVARLGKGGEVASLSKDFGHLLYRAGLRASSPYDQVGKGGKKAARAAAGRRQGQELSFHSLRHTARSWLEEAGVPKAVIDALVGHSGEMGRIYTTVGIEALREAAEKLEGRVKGEG